MEIRVQSTAVDAVAVPALIVFATTGDRPVGEGPADDGAAAQLDTALDGALAALAADGELTAKRDQVLLVHSLGRLPAGRLLVTGLGDAEKLTADVLRNAAANAARRARGAGGGELAIALDGPPLTGMGVEEAAEAVVQGAILGLYRFDRHREPADDARTIDQITLLTADAAAAERGGERGRIIAEQANLARDLQNEPSNFLTPTEMANRARTMAEEVGIDCEILEEDALRSLGMGAFLGVAAGSHQPPRLIVLRYRGGADGDPAIGLIGKGITFDTGGISLKPSASMESMKQDMSGGAAVIAAIGGVARLRLPLNVTAIVPATENMPGGSAIKPSDVLRAMNGKTIEVMNTDAEGRLILADALAYANHLHLTPLIDVATLTGAIAVTLGNQAAGIMANDDALSDALIAAGREAGERLWPLPMYEEYDEQLKSNVADMKNVGGRGGGSITAARFLAKFAGEAPWAHLDIASVDDSDKEQGVKVKGGTGTPVRTLIQFLRDRADA